MCLLWMIYLNNETAKTNTLYADTAAGILLQKMYFASYATVV